MKILAVSAKGAEYMYKASTAHAVPQTKAEYYRDTLNEVGYKLKEGETWYIHEVDKYDIAYEYAEMQKFYTANGVMKEKHCY